MALEGKWESYPPEHLLKERFHITTGFHPEQQEIIEHLVHRKRVLAISTHRLGQITKNLYRNSVNSLTAFLLTS